jgi:endonuclease/exonuclease/phosphatase family metal-dependent hydrolase
MNRLKTISYYILKRIQLLIFILFVGFPASSQTIEDISFGTDDTFEVVTWNIEHFPKSNQTTIEYVSRVLKAIDADIYAIQEVSDTNSFNELVNSLSDYEGYLDSDKFRGLAYIYKKNTVEINHIYEIYNSSEYYSPFPRYPMVLDLNFKGERMIIINNHFKCCGDGALDAQNQSDEEVRREKASTLLKQYIDTNFANLNVILVGDLNDILIDVAPHNVFKAYFDDAENYKFVDYEIATGASAGWSFPTWPSHLDHILITNELFDEYANVDTVVEVIKLEEYITGGWDAYDSAISDHRPVALKFKLNQTLDTADEVLQTVHFTNYPNPFTSSTTFSFNTITESGNIVIYNIFGQKVFSSVIAAGQNSVTWSAKKKPSGIYIAKLSVHNNIIRTLKLIVNK